MRFAPNKVLPQSELLRPSPLPTNETYLTEPFTRSAFGLDDVPRVVLPVERLCTGL
jgi:hypothetical protein